MTEALILIWLTTLAVVQASWCLYYGLRYHWRSTPLGPVWLAKGTALALLWPTLLLDQFAEVSDWLWALVVGPVLTAATLAWLVVTVRVRRRVHKP